MLQTEEQILRALKGAKHVLITSHETGHVDSLASSLALSAVLKSMGVAADIVITAPTERLHNSAFLTGFGQVRTDRGALQHLVIRVGGSGVAVKDFRYEVVGDTLTIFLTPNDGPLMPAHVKTEAVGPTHDLVVTVDTPDLPSLGTLYADHADFFYRTPIINIDHNPGNEHFGQMNLVDITAVSTTEVIYRFLANAGAQMLAHVTPDVATALLVGMIAKTSSFKTPNVTPRSLQLAAELVEKGARREEVIHHLYRQHDLSTLKLWGRVLARLQYDATQEFVWSLITKEDFEKSGAPEGRLGGLIDELINTSPQAKIVALLFEHGNGTIGGYLHTPPHTNALTLTQAWQSKGTSQLAEFTIPVATLAEALQALKAIIGPAVPIRQ